MGTASTNNHIVITGCSSGFGHLLAHKFAEQEWQVLATTRHPDKMKSGNSNIFVLGADIATPQGRADVENYVQNDWEGKLDCLVNNAGFGLGGPFEMLTEEQVRHQMEVNFFASLFLTQTLLSKLRAEKGKIINISSLLGGIGMPLMSLYAGSKFALEGWSESLHYELKPHGVQVALVEPAGFRTGFASNMEWPEKSSSNGSLYTDQLQGIQNCFDKLSTKGNGNNPAQVIEKIFDLANRRKMPLRTRVGGGAHSLYYMRRILPQRTSDFVIGVLCKKMLKV